MRRIFVLMIGLAAVAVAACAGDAPLVKPAPIAGPSPFRYPLALWDSGQQGETLLLVHVTEAGRVDSVKVWRSSGKDSLGVVRLPPASAMGFDAAATSGAYALRFVPGHQGARRLAMWVKLPVRFSRDTTGPQVAS